MGMDLNKRIEVMKLNNNYSDSLQKYIPQCGNVQYNSTALPLQPSSISASDEREIFFQSDPDVGSSKSIVISQIEAVAQWFLFNMSVSNKKLQKLCYYAYCWFIVFNNDVEAIEEGRILTLCEDKFQAWIHGPVCPRLYYKYKENGWMDIPRSERKPQLPQEIEALLKQVLDAYGGFTADELENLSHSETPWKNARIGVEAGEACTEEISTSDILLYYSTLR